MVETILWSISGLLLPLFATVLYAVSMYVRLVYNCEQDTWISALFISPLLPVWFFGVLNSFFFIAAYTVSGVAVIGILLMAE